MTENEALLSALKKVKEQKENFGFMDRFNVDENWEVMKALGEIQQYRAIGTIEEFKALKEKSVAKKAKKSGVTDSNGVFHEIDGIDGVPYDLCPNCEINLCTDGMFGGNRSGIKFCKNCGQKLDWSE